jgi:hypothetical protein
MKMAMIKVIYVDQSAGRIADSRLDDLIAKGKIAAFFSLDGWVDVEAGQITDVVMGQPNLKERGREHETAGNKGNSSTKRADIGEDE